MKKLISAVTSLCMTVSMISAVVPENVAASDSSKWLSIKTYDIDAPSIESAESDITIKQEDIPEEGYILPCAVYYSEQTNDTTSISVEITADSDDIRFVLHDPTTPYTSEKRKYTLIDGGEIETSYYPTFAGIGKSRKTGDIWVPYGDYAFNVYEDQPASGTNYCTINGSWTMNEDTGYRWTDSRSDSYPFYVFDVIIPQNIEPGSYTVEFHDYVPDPTKPDNRSSMIESANDVYTTKKSNLTLSGFSFEVEASDNIEQYTVTLPDNMELCDGYSLDNGKADYGTEIKFKAKDGYIASNVKNGETVLTPDENGVYSVTVDGNVTVSAEFAEKAFSGASLALGDDLVLNFYSDLITAEDHSEYTVKFSGKCVDSSSGFTEKDGKYRASAHIYAKDINAEITATLYKGDEQVGAPLTYSASKYLEDLNTSTDSSDTLTHDLIMATLDFGNASEEYFYGTDLHTINAVEDQLYGLLGIQSNDELKEALAPYAADFTSDEAKLSLVLDSKTANRLYIKDMQAGTQDDAGKYTSVSGNKSTDEYPSYFEISGLLPQELAKEQSITVDGRAYTFSALSWADRVMSQDEPSERNVTMAKAVTAYYLAAHNYYEAHTVDLSQLTDSYYAKDGDILTGTTDRQIYVTGVTVTLKDAEAQNGIVCKDNSTILLEGTNKAKISIYGGTLTIDGEGSLTANGSSGDAGIGGFGDANLIINGGNITATGGDSSAGIGGSWEVDSGDITINGGNVTAIGGRSCPGIGTGYTSGVNYYKCGDITINGGTVTAIGGYGAPGIGSVVGEECGDITIADTVEKVTATKGEYATYSIGTDDSTCGTITIGGKVYYEDGDYVNGGDTYLAQDTIVYPEPVETIDLSALTADYTAKNGDILTGELKENVKISVEDGAKVTLKNVTINGVDDKNYKWAGITCEGDAELILEGENTVSEFYHDYPGIYIAPEKTLTIDGNGTLNASSEFHAGIGGGYRLSCGNIVINGGTINATGHTAGIGGGYNDDTESVITCGDITINGGNVTAAVIGGSSGSGIGSGHSNGGNITITGGTVIATANRYSPGIGCSVSMDGESSCGDIIISGGNVTATGGDNAAGIGTGNNAKCGNITISGGTVNAESTDVPEQSDCAAGIGTGLNGKCGAILISGGTVTAVGVDYGSAIGSEFGNNYKSVTITADVISVTVKKGKDATYYFGKPFEESSNVTIEDYANIIKI